MLARLLACATALAGIAAAQIDVAHADGMARSKGGMYAPAASATSTAVFSGIDVVEDSISSYTGFVSAFNRDLSKDGFLLRGVGVYASYEYGTLDSLSNRITVEGSAPMVDMMLGYQFIRPGVRSAIYLGGEYQNHDLSPNDRANPVRDDEFGFKVAGDIETTSANAFYFGLLGSYSTAFDTYWARGRIGWNFGRLVIGPEGGLSGNDGYDARRVGGFVRFPIALGTRDIDVSIAAGHQFLKDDSTSSSGGGEGAYVSAGFSTSF